MRHRRTGLVVSLLAIGLTLSACESMDPSEWFSTKKPLPGERRAVFPEGVPGVPQGVPAELVEGYQAPLDSVPEPRVVEEKPKPKAKPKPKPKPAMAAAPQPAAQPAAPQPAAGAAPQRGASAPWPNAAPPAQGQPAQSQSAFPDPPRR